MDFTWATFNGSELLGTITKLMMKLFTETSGSAGNSFVLELAHLLQALDASSMEYVYENYNHSAGSSSTKTHKTRDHILHLKRRMEIWKAVT